LSILIFTTVWLVCAETRILILANPMLYLNKYTTNHKPKHCWNFLNNESSNATIYICKYTLLNVSNHVLSHQKSNGKNERQAYKNM